MLNLTTDPINI